MTKQKLFVAVTGFATTALLIVLMLSVIVRQGQTAIVTTFGKVDRTVTEPGLTWRLPWPIQQVHVFDMRLHSYPGTMQQVLTKDGKNVLITLFGTWRIADPQIFLERIGTMEQAENQLESLLRGAGNATIGQHPFSLLVNVNAEEFRMPQIEKEILDAARPEALTRYGLDFVSVGIRQLAFPDTITEKIYARMRAEREEIAERFRAEGESESIRIRAEAGSKRDQALADAEAEAKKIRADGDAAAAEYYRVFAQNPELANFLKKLEVLEETLRTKSTVVLGSDTEPYDLLLGPEAPAGEE